MGRLYKNMDILIIIFLLSFFIKIRIRENQEDYLSKDYTIYIKGILALIVVFCHIQFNRINFVGFKVFNYVGDFAVALFFFLSGYGLISQYIKKGDIYLKSFLKKRVLKIMFIYLFFNFIYIVYYLLCNNFESINLLKYVFIDKKLIVSHSWYIIDILILYILFYIFAKKFNKNYNNISKGILICSIIFGIVLIVLGYEECWYVSLLSFYFGFFYKLFLDKKVNLKNIIFLILCFVILECMLLLIDFINISMVKIYLTALIKNLACICFILIVINLGKIIQFRNPFFKFMGNISLEVYLIHGLFENIFRNIHYISSNYLLYGFMVLSLSILGGYQIKKYSERLY